MYKMGLSSNVTFLHLIDWDFSYQCCCAKKGHSAMSLFYTKWTQTIVININVQKGAI